MKSIALICLLALAGNFARAHDPYEITSVVYVRSNVIELFIEMEFPAGMRLAGVEPVRDVAVLSQFEKAQPQLAVLAGSFFDFTAGNNTVAALSTNVALGMEDHIQFKLEYAATSLRPLQFTARGLRSGTDSPYGTSLTVLDMVNQKVLGQTTLFADSPRAEFPPATANTNESPTLVAATNARPATAVTNLPPSAIASATNTPNGTNGTNAPTPLMPTLASENTDWFIVVISLGAVVLMVLAFFRRR